MSSEVKTIGGFPEASPDCKGCGKPLELKNAWMTDGCPCNHHLGVNNKNETRWRLLMQLQQRQSIELEACKKCLFNMQAICGLIGKASTPNETEVAWDRWNRECDKIDKLLWTLSRCPGTAVAVETA